MPQLLKPSYSGLARLRELCDSLDEAEASGGFFDDTPDLMAVITGEGVISEANPSWYKLLGWAEGELEEMPLTDFVHGDDRQMLLRELGCLETRSLTRFMCRMRHHSGDFLVVEFSASKLRKGVSRIIGRLVPDTCLSCPEAQRQDWRAHANDCCNWQKQQ